MEKYIYDLRFKADETEWRARARRDLVVQLYQKYRTQSINYLDYGCGSGALIKRFQEYFPRTYGFDSSKKVINYCRKQGLLMGKRKHYFDLVTAIDVLEHIRNDVKTLKDIYSFLKPGGLGIFIVPAHMSLWTSRDKRLRHFRRYESGELEKKCKKAGFKILAVKNSDFQPYLVFKILKFFSKENVSIDIPKVSNFQNSLLYFFEKGENFLQRFTTFPIGVSICLVVKKV